VENQYAATSRFNFKQPAELPRGPHGFSWRCESIVQRRRLRASSPRGFKIRAAWNDLILRSRVTASRRMGPRQDCSHSPRDLAAWVRASFDPRCPALLDRGRRECRMRVAPVAACAEKKHRRQQPGLHRINRHSLHNGVTAYTRSPRGPGFLAPSPAVRFRKFSASVGAPRTTRFRRSANSIHSSAP